MTAHFYLFKKKKILEKILIKIRKTIVVRKRKSK